MPGMTQVSFSTGRKLRRRGADLNLKSDTYLISKLSSMCCIPLHREPLCYLLFVQSVVPCIRSFPLHSNVPHCIPSYSATFGPLTSQPFLPILMPDSYAGYWGVTSRSYLNFISRYPCTQDTTRMPECTGHILNRWNDVATSSDYAILFFNNFFMMIASI